MLNLAERGEIKALEDRWLDAIEKPDADHSQLIEVLAALTKRGKADAAGAPGLDLAYQLPREG